MQSVINSLDEIFNAYKMHLKNISNIKNTKYKKQGVKCYLISEEEKMMLCKQAENSFVEKMNLKYQRINEILKKKGYKKLVNPFEKRS